MKSLKLIIVFLFMLFVPIFSNSQDHGVTDVHDKDNVLPVRKQLEVMQGWLKWRLDNILPALMRREEIDMWLIINRGEYNRDPLSPSFYGINGTSWGGTGTIIFHDNGGEDRIERFSIGGGDLYEPITKDWDADQFEVLADFIKKRNPKKIGINVSSGLFWDFADGLTAHSKESLEKALGPELSSRLVSAERLCIGWLETRSPQELNAYRHICGVAHDIFAEFFSNKVIIPDVTTTDDVIWWIRQKFIELGVGTWFQPIISIQRYVNGKVKFLRKEAFSTEKENKDANIIRRGDLLHCDIGIVYLGLCTDNQQNAYVCKIGEDDAPEGLKDALRGANKLQDIFMKEFKEGRTGNEIFHAAIEKAKKAGLDPSIYTHPLGYHGHGAGPIMGMIIKQKSIPIYGEYPLYLNTCHSIELHVMHEVPEWGNQKVRMAVEEDAAFTKEGCKFIDGRQTKLYLIK